MGALSFWLGTRNIEISRTRNIDIIALAPLLPQTGQWKFSGDFATMTSLEGCTKRSGCNPVHTSVVRMCRGKRRGE